MATLLPGSLFESAAAGDIAAVNQWLATATTQRNSGGAADGLPLQVDKSTPFLVAARHGQLEVLQALHVHHPNIPTGLGAPRNDGVTPLLAACSQGHATVAEWVWHRLPDDARSARSQTDRGALEMAASSGSAPLVKWLLLHSSCIEPVGALPIELVRRLLRDACTSRPSWDDRAGHAGSIRFTSTACEGSVEIIKLLCAASDECIDLATARLGVGGGTGPTLFVESCGRGNATLVRWLASQEGVATAGLAADESLLPLVAAQGHAQVAGIILDMRKLFKGHCAKLSVC